MRFPEAATFLTSQIEAKISFERSETFLVCVFLVALELA